MLTYVLIGAFLRHHVSAVSQPVDLLFDSRLARSHRAGT